MKKEFLNNMQLLLGDEFEQFMSALSGDSQKAFRINTLKTDGTDIAFKEEKVPWATCGYYHSVDKIGNTRENRLGLVYSQDASAMAPAEILSPLPGDTVLDLCAAPGGKATQLAQMMQGRGILVANEIVPSRCKILYENIERLGVSNAIVLNENPKNLESRFEGYFDKILVDAPCSGEGMFRKDSAAADEWTPDTNEICAMRQKLILESAVKMLKPGGRLVYSTCTFSPVENEYLISEITETHPELYVIPIETDTLTDGIAPMNMTKRIYPHHQRGEGHFIALLEKNGGTAVKTAEMRPDKPDKLFKDFCDKYLCNIEFNTYISGNKVFLHKHLLPDLKGLKWYCAGIYAGDILKGRFEPAHHLATALKKDNFRNIFELSADNFDKYIRGETIPADINGWCAMLSDGYPAGWGKGSGGIIKNHYPKGLRKTGK